MGLRPTQADESSPRHTAPDPRRARKKAVLIDPGAAMTFNRAVMKFPVQCPTLLDPLQPVADPNMIEPLRGMSRK